MQGEQLGDSAADTAPRRRSGNDADLVGKKHFPTSLKLDYLTVTPHDLIDRVLQVYLKVLGDFLWSFA
jgi:hypothetical protein